MTCREKLKLIRPALVDPKFDGGCFGCPRQYGIMPDPLNCESNEISCEECWDREIPGTEPTVEPTKPTEPKEDVVNHPNHYTNGGMECIDEMILIFGKETVAHFCLCNAWKYRYRALYKNKEEDMQKSHWYINKYKELVESCGKAI
jgi:hypothetical protein